jgi:hypothetical protein
MKQILEDCNCTVIIQHMNISVQIWQVIILKILYKIEFWSRRTSLRRAPQWNAVHFKFIFIQFSLLIPLTGFGSHICYLVCH